ncbi:MAG: DUF1020 domain-containing protein [Proteobacteria bacterium]|nr:MAG: DUF1020 domain-containing protein [Pseudomonadota bacterium]
MKRHRRHRIAGRRLAGLFAFRPLAMAASIVLPFVVLPASLEAASPIENSIGNLNAHLQVHSAAVGQASSPARTGGAHTHNQVLGFARALLNLRVDLQVPYDPTGGNAPGVRNAGGGYGGDLATDLFVQQQVSIDNWAPGGPNNSFNDRGTLIAQDGSVVITPTSSYQIGNFNLQTAAINGQYTYVNDIDANHGAGVHSPFDLTSSSSGSADTTTDTSEVRVDLQWLGTYDHPANAYDAPQGGGYPAPIGALDFFTFDIVGNAAAQYFNPTGLGGSNQQPGLPDLPELPSLPDFDDQQLPNELAGLNPYAPPRTNNGNDPYNPYNPPRYTDPNYNPYNPNTYTDPNYNPYNPTSYNSNNPYLASNPYNARGAPDNSALLAALGGSASNVNNQSQFDLSWMTEIEQAQGVQHYQDYGSFSSVNSAVFRGIIRTVQLTAVNQQDLASYIAATGNIPSTIATQVNVLDDRPGGVTSFANLDDYENRRSGNTPPPPNQQNTNPFGYNTFAGDNQGSNAGRVGSYQGTGTTPAEFGGTPTPNPLGYDTDPLFAANNPGGNRIGSFDTANSYDDNAQGGLLSGASGYQSAGGDVLSYGGATGYDGYDSSTARQEKQSEIDAALDAERGQVAEIEKQEAQEAAMESLTLKALELAKRETSSEPESPPQERNPTNKKIIEIAPGVYITEQDDGISKSADGTLTNEKPLGPDWYLPDEEETSGEQRPKTVDELFAERFGWHEDGGYDFDDPHQDPNATESEKSPREKAFDYYGGDLISMGYGKYLEYTAADFDELPSWVRTSDTYQNYKLYEFMLDYERKHPDSTDEEASRAFGKFYRGLTGIDYDNEYMDTLLWNTAVDAKENGVAWDAAWKGVKGSFGDILDQLELQGKLATTAGQGELLISGGKLILDLVGMSAEEREQFLSPLTGPARELSRFLDLDPEQQQEKVNQLLRDLETDIVENPEKYTEMGVRVTITSLVDYLTGKVAFSPGVESSGIFKPTLFKPEGEPLKVGDRFVPGDGMDVIPDQASRVGEGGFGVVEFTGEKGQLVKTITTGDTVDEMFSLANRQYDGYKLAKNNGIETVEIYDIGTTKDGKAYLVVEDVEGPRLGNSGLNARIGTGTLDDLNPEEFDAFVDLMKDIDSKGLIWGDAKPSNVYFYVETQADGVTKMKAGIVDHDLLVTKQQYKNYWANWRDASPEEGGKILGILMNGSKNIRNGLGNNNLSEESFEAAVSYFRSQGRDTNKIDPTELFVKAAEIESRATN